VRERGAREDSFTVYPILFKNNFNLTEATMRVLVSLLVVIVFLSGCASIVSKSEWPVTINSNPEQANITITNEDGLKMYTGTTPTTLNLKAGEAYFDGIDYTVVFEKEGYEKQTIIISSRLNGWYFGNILFGGLIGMLIVDPLTGAMWKLDSLYVANLSEKTSFLEQEGKTIQFVLLDDVPVHLRDKMVRVK
jgi:hypothetical protein